MRTAFYSMHNMPTRESLLAVLESGPFTLPVDRPKETVEGFVPAIPYVVVPQ